MTSLVEAEKELEREEKFERKGEEERNSVDHAIMIDARPESISESMESVDLEPWRSAIIPN